MQQWVFLVQLDYWRPKKSRQIARKTPKILQYFFRQVSCPTVSDFLAGRLWCVYNPVAARVLRFLVGLLSGVTHRGEQCVVVWGAVLNLREGVKQTRAFFLVSFLLYFNHSVKKNCPRVGSHFFLERRPFYCPNLFKTREWRLRIPKKKGLFFWK